MHDETLTALDAALIGARRLFEMPPVVSDEGARIEGSTLLVLAAVDAADSPASIGTIARWLDVTHSTASRLVRRAVEADTVARSPSPDDRRGQVLSVTPSGALLTLRAREHRRAHLERLVAGWPHADVAALTQLLARLTDRSDQQPTHTKETMIDDPVT